MNCRLMDRLFFDSIVYHAEQAGVYIADIVEPHVDIVCRYDPDVAHGGIKPIERDGLELFGEDRFHRAVFHDDGTF